MGPEGGYPLSEHPEYQAYQPYQAYQEQQEYQPYQALYLHIPFCQSRCGYCDFTTQAVAADDPLLDTVVTGFEDDLRVAAEDGLLREIKTIYLGGGTPSFLGHERLVKLVVTLCDVVPKDALCEFTLEANPESLTREMVRDLAALGVTRISMGVQSFDNRELAFLGRIHDAACARKALQDALEYVEDVSLDLMCGIPLQTMESWDDTLTQAMDLGVTHISVYPLTIEEDTPFGRMLETGALPEVDEDLQAAFMERAACKLDEAGFHRYEVASYARGEHACRHNCAYWTGVPYLGLGRGAAGMRQGPQGRERLMDQAVVETLTPQEALWEDLMLGMRMSVGVSLELVSAAAVYLPAIRETFSELEGLGLVSCTQGRYRPTSQGWLMGNQLYGRIWHSRPGR